MKRKIVTAAKFLNKLDKNKFTRVVELIKHAGVHQTTAENIIRDLKNARIIECATGPGGGCRLLIDKKFISVGLLVNVFDAFDKNDDYAIALHKLSCEILGSLNIGEVEIASKNIGLTY